MRVLALGLLAGAALLITVAGACWQRAPAYAQPPGGLQKEQRGPSSELIALASEAGPGLRQVILVEPKSRVMGVYHIELATGEISLKSVRNVHWDLLMDEFNGTSPSPREIRALLDHK